MDLRSRSTVLVAVAAITFLVGLVAGRAVSSPEPEPGDAAVPEAADAPRSVQAETDASPPSGFPHTRDGAVEAATSYGLALDGPLLDATLGVLAYVPDWDDLEFAASLAWSGSLVAVEGTATPLEGWARWHQAVDLVTGEVAEPLAEAVRIVVERLKFYGNNGFARGFGRDQAIRVVRDVPADAHGLVLGALLAAGQRASGVKRLAGLLQ